MSVLIKGMEIPTNCQHCPCADDDSRYCKAANEYIPMLGKPKFCPLIVVPTPHGRLIDADALDAVVQDLNEAGFGITRIDYKRMASVLFEWPTIIEAEGDEE